MANKILNFIWFNLELFFWIIALILLFVIEPDQVHFTLCPISNLGFDFCPGCGLGRSIHYAMWLDFKASFNLHPVGIFGLIIILHRIFILTVKLIKTNNHEHYTFTTHSGR